MRTVRRPPHSGRLRPKTPQGPRGHFKYQPHGYAMDTIYPPHSYGRSGYTQGVIIGNSRLSGIGRGHPRFTIRHPQTAGGEPGPICGRFGGEMENRVGDNYSKQLSDPHPVQVGSTAASLDLSRAIHHAFRENRPGQIECSVYSTYCTLPITSCGRKLSDEAGRVAVGLRLGANIYVNHIRALAAYQLPLRECTDCHVSWALGE